MLNLYAIHNTLRDAQREEMQAVLDVTALEHVEAELLVDAEQRVQIQK